MRYLITGGAGFIGSAFVRGLIQGSLKSDFEKIVILDSLTYSGSLENLGEEVLNDTRVEFVKGDIRESELITKLVGPSDVIFNFAAESHVDRSIVDPEIFLSTNVGGTLNLLNAMRTHSGKRLVQISTDEVYGSILHGSWDETFPLKPNSPYSASKASADLMVLAFHTTYNLDVVITRCCNNYGPFQYPEKLIPLFIKKLLNGEKVPIYGDGSQTREWIHVDDHCRGILLAALKGEAGEIYNLGTSDEIQNLDLAKILINELGVEVSQLDFVSDRPGHDQRYSLNTTKSRNELKFEAQIGFTEGLRDTINWYRRHLSSNSG
jgi:dTDP-glucose 4,6-dehydratase